MSKGVPDEHDGFVNPVLLFVVLETPMIVLDEIAQGNEIRQVIPTRDLVAHLRKGGALTVLFDQEAAQQRLERLQIQDDVADSVDVILFFHCLPLPL
jgi:hypothetical protein